jgi:hypothetical protein
MRLAVLSLIGVGLLGGAQQGDGIIRLKSSDFKQLPVAVRKDLDRRRCLIPQVSEKPAPHNVTVGAFVAAGSRDWAVLCSIKGESRILVYREGKTARVDSLAKQKDGTSRIISMTTAKSIKEHAEAYNGPKPPRLDHEGIDDGHWEKGSIVWYYSRGRWMELAGAN